MFDDVALPGETEPKMRIKLSMKELLPKVREAFDNKTLQMFTNPGNVGSYRGPCAIGVGLTEDQRAYGDNNEFDAYSVDDNASAGIFQFPSTDEEYDAQCLQTAHDEALSIHPETQEYYRKEFEEVLKGLEEKYL